MLVSLGDWSFSIRVWTARRQKLVSFEVQLQWTITKENEKTVSLRRKDLRNAKKLRSAFLHVCSSAIMILGLISSM